MDTYKITLKDFLTTGRLGPVRVGLTRDEVMKTLGEPPDWSIRGHGKDRDKADIWRYGIMQIAFSHVDQNSVTYLGLYPEQTIDLPELLQIEGYFPTDETTFEEFLNYLGAEQLTHINDPKITFPETFPTLRVASQVTVPFRDDGTLYAMMSI